MSPWNNSVFSSVAVKEFIQSYVNSDSAIIFLHDKGIIGGQLVPLFFGTGIYAVEQFWFADSHGRLLLDCFEQWAKEHKADRIILSSLIYNDEKDERIKKMYSKMGYNPLEVHYTKDLY